MAIQDLSDAGLRTLLSWQFDEAQANSLAGKNGSYAKLVAENEERLRASRARRAELEARAVLFEAALDELCRRFDVELLGGEESVSFAIRDGYVAPGVIADL